MPETFNIYCDESCHLEHDKQPRMLLGAVWCKADDVRHICEAVREIKTRYRARGELKWTKVSKSRCEFYLELVDRFCSTHGLNFRCLVVDDKSKLNHSYFNQGDHDSFYYKMYYYLIRNILNTEYRYNIYIDIKDTKSQAKINTLKGVLCRAYHDFEGMMISNMQHIRSHESELMQLSDFLLGAVSYKCRGLTRNTAKNDVIQRIQAKVGIDLGRSTPPWEEKFNIFFFSPREVG